MRRLSQAALLALSLAWGAAPAASVVGRFCGLEPATTAAQHDRLLRVAAVLRGVLDEGGHGAVLVSRSGLDLSRFGLRHSHAGLALAEGAGTRWAVRQLYYDCEQGRPQVYDQGLAGFVAGTHEAGRGFFSLVLLPPEAAAAVSAAALDRARALRLLAGAYSANAHAWSLRYQNCNQWLAELLATGDGALADGADLRARAQQRLRETGYEPARVDAGSHWVMFAGGFVPWLHLDDRPQDEQHSLVFRISVPASLEAYARQRWPAAQRVALCHAGARIVVRRGWQSLPEDCTPAPGDEVHPL